MTQRRRLRATLILACVPALLLLLIGEIAARGFYWYRHGHEVAWLLIPFRQPAAMIVVLYYEGYNDVGNLFQTVDAALTRFHARSWVGRLTAGLYYRSMLYTYLVEKCYSYAITWSQRFAPRLAAYRREWWLIPILVLLALCGALVAAGQQSVMAPFVYTDAP